MVKPLTAAEAQMNMNVVPGLGTQRMSELLGCPVNVPYRTDPDDRAFMPPGPERDVAAQNSALKQLEMIMKGGRVKRFHAKSLLREESVAAHSYLVAWCAWMVQAGEPSLKLVLACLSHDLPEHVTGDVPSPTKRLTPGLKEAMAQLEDRLFKDAGIPNYEAELDAPDAEVLHFCDNYAGWLKCLEERRMGNQTLINTEARYKDYLYAILTAAEHLPKERCHDMIDIVTAKGVPL